MFWIVLAVVILLFLLWICLKPFDYWTKMGVPQINPWPIIGDTWPTLFRRKNVLEWIEYFYYAYPNSKYVGIYQFRQPTLVLRDPDLIKQLTIKDFDHFTDHNSLAIAEEVDPLWARNLFALKGQRWRDMRALLSASFTSSKMKIMYCLIGDEAKKFVNYFLKSDKEIQELELKEWFTKYTNDVIASTSFGIQVNSLENPENEFFIMGKEVTNFSGLVAILKFIATLACPWIFKLLDMGFLSKKARKFFQRITDETILARETQKIVRPDMINLLLQSRKGQNNEEEQCIEESEFAVVQESSDLLIKPQKRQMEISNIDIAAQALIFFFAGYDTVSSVMCYTSYELATNLEIQTKLREEIKEMFEKTKGNPTYEDILGMKYLDMVVSESLRKWPVAPAADRLCVKPYTIQPKDENEPKISLKASDIIWVPIYSFHRDPKYYPEPEKFIPERFSEENKAKIEPYTYMPFGIGPRACIGSRFALLEIKAVLFYLLNSFEIVPTKQTRIPLKISKTAINVTPEGGFPLGFRRIPNNI